jgi:Flp pilus assembly pilin Flp
MVLGEMAPRPTHRQERPSRRGLVEVLLLTGFLALAAAGAVALFGDELRQAFGASAAGPAAAAPPRP